jgi:hypothetical protein
MKLSDFSQHLAKGAYRATRVLVVILSVLAILIGAVFVFLRIYGVPEPLLQEVLRRVNAAGVPVEIEGITLTLHGWRADRVKYYSRNPDDLEPLFMADQVYFSLRNSKQRRAGSDHFSLDLKAVEIDINPSVEWGLALPESTPGRRVDQVKVSVTVLPDRIRLTEGRIDWLNIVFTVNGDILKRAARADETRRQMTLLPKPVSEEQFLAFEKQLGKMSLPGGASVEIEFLVDTADYRKSHMELAIEAEEMDCCGFAFSRVDVSGSYDYPSFQLERAGLYAGKQSIQLSGMYDVESRQAWGSVYNSITSARLLLLLPEPLRELTDKAGLRINQLPRLTVDFGPAAPQALLNHLSGAFTLYDVEYQGTEITSLHGRIKSEGRRIEFTNLQGSVAGRDPLPGGNGSALQGGTAEGSVFWDADTRAFGVAADVNFDPNLLVGPLSPVKIATNIIRRFAFTNRPPQGHVELGAQVDDWSTFYINIQAVADEVEFQGVEFSSMNVVQTYSRSRLRLDPATALQNAEFIRGSAEIDFKRDLVTFDASSSINPADLEDMIYPGLGLFGHHIRADGAIRMEARGCFDWGTMKQTRFSALVEAERLDIPVASLDRFTAEAGGSGPALSVSNAVFGLYDGNGEGTLVCRWSPPDPALPYELDVSFSGVDFNDFLSYLSRERPVKVSGIMEGRAAIEADFSTNFHAAANGSGFVRVENGQLADLPVFDGFSRLMRRIFPAFTVFSITSLRGHFRIEQGVISSEDAYFGGDVLSARGRGSYTQAEGFDAYIQAQMLSEGRVLKKMVQILTDPLMKLLEIRLEGSLDDPSWHIKRF